MLSSSLSFIFSSSFLKQVQILTKLTIDRVTLRSQPFYVLSLVSRRLVKGVLIFFCPLYCSRLCVPSASATTPENRPEHEELEHLGVPVPRGTQCVRGM
jgi:hypothetical protein